MALSFSERSRQNPALGTVLAVGVLAASAVMVPRLLILLSIVQPTLVTPMLPPFAALFVITTFGGLLAYQRSQREVVDVAELHNPFELKTALQFAALFALILLVARAAQELLGERGVYIASILAGVTNLNAITLALGKQVESGLEPSVATKGLALALGQQQPLQGWPRPLFRLESVRARCSAYPFSSCVGVYSGCVAGAALHRFLRFGKD